MIGQDQGDDGVVSLPERRDEKECHTHEYGAFVIELHVLSFPTVANAILRTFSVLVCVWEDTDNLIL